METDLETNVSVENLTPFIYIYIYIYIYI
jgi:hypothetical protein